MIEETRKSKFTGDCEHYCEEMRISGNLKYY